MRKTFVFLACMSLSLVAQGAKDKKGAPAPAPAPTPAPAAPQTPEVSDIAAIKQVPYQPTVSREPFLPLGDSTQKGTGDYVDDIAVKGQYKTNGKVFAIVSDSRGNVRWLEIGYRFKDGMIAAIDEKSVTFHQWDPNTSNTNVFRKVVKTFKREETKR